MDRGRVRVGDNWHIDLTKTPPPRRSPGGSLIFDLGWQYVGVRTLDAPYRDGIRVVTEGDMYVWPIQKDGEVKVRFETTHLLRVTRGDVVEFDGRVPLTVLQILKPGASWDELVPLIPKEYWTK